MTPHKGDFSCVFLPKHEMLWEIQVVMHPRQQGGRKTVLIQMLTQLSSCVSTIHPHARKGKKPQGKIPWDTLLFL